MGGQSAITGSHVSLRSPNTTAFGSESLSLLGNVPGKTILETLPGPTNGDYYVPTDANGNFSITGDYVCTPGTGIYLYAWGGNPGLAAGTNNTGIVLLAVLGICPSSGTLVGQVPYVTVNEVSTVAAAYALGGYAFDASHISSSGSAPALVGLTNAFLNAANLVNVATGQALTKTPAGNATVPQAEIDTLANIMSSCVNSAGLSSTECTSLMTNEHWPGDPSRGHDPNDTATALINLVHNPQANIAALMALAPSTPPFVPALTAAPKDFTVSLSFTGAGLSNPFAIAIDGSGNAWTTNTSCNCLSELSPEGAPMSGPGGFTGGGLNVPEFLVVDLLSAVWISNSGSNGISEFSSAGAAISPSSGFTDPSLNTPVGLAIDGSNNVWIPNYSNSSVTELNHSGSAISPPGGFTGGGLALPVGVYIDKQGRIWDTNFYDQAVTVRNSVGTAVSPPGGYPLPGANDPSAMAIDFNGNVWVLNLGTENIATSSLNANTGALFEVSGTGGVLSPTGGYPCGTLSYPYAMAVDGDGDPWVANSGKNQVGSCSLNFYGSGTPAPAIATGGSTGTTLNLPYSIAIDPSGNVWVPNYLGNSVTQFIGIAAPVATPIPTGLITTAYFAYRL